MILNVSPFAILSNLLIFGTTCIQAKRLPEIWKDEFGDVKFYKFTSELETLHYSGKSFLLEEWASTTRQMFRLDALDPSTGLKRTVLANKVTRENFEYEPFKCSLVNDFRNSLQAELDNCFPHAPDRFLPSGIGSLWTHALKLEANYTEAQGTRIGRVKSGFNLTGYSKYSVPKTEDYPYNLEFYFTGKGKENLKTLALIRQLSALDSDGGGKVLMRIRVLEVESIFSIDDDDSKPDVFDLPPGYGCPRAQDLHGLAPPRPIYPVDQQRTPYLLHLDIVALAPVRGHSHWRSHSSSVRLLTGQLATAKDEERNYLILEQQDYAPEWESPRLIGSPFKKASLRRVRQVLDLGVVQEKATQSRLRQKSAPERSGSVSYFELDQLTGKCLSYGDALPGSSPILELSVAPSSDEQPANGPTSSQESSSPVMPTRFSLTTGLVEKLFASTEGYHLIKEDEGGSKGATHERREESLEIRDSRGHLTWRGPVSIVRRAWVQARSRSSSSDNGANRRQQISVTVNLLSPDLDQLVGRIQFSVAQRRPVDRSYLHAELNVASCFASIQMAAKGSSLGAANFVGRPMRALRPVEELHFSLTYPVESVEILNKLAESELTEALAYEQFLAALVALCDGRLDLLQLVDLRVSMEQELIRVSGKLMSKPSLLNYRREAGQRFVHSKRPLLYAEFKVNEEACADTCAHYRCATFAYCSQTKECDLMLANHGLATSGGDDNDEELAGQLEPDATCSVFRARESPPRAAPMSPLEVAHRLRLTVHEQQELGVRAEVGSTVDGSTVHSRELLALRLNYRPLTGETTQELKVLPESLEINEPMSLGATGSLTGGITTSLRAEYVLLAENKRFKMVDKLSEMFPIRRAKRATYEECEALCEQTDCRSFSHCSMGTNGCLVSQLYQTSLIEAQLEEEHLCRVMVRDYLSKFQQSIQVSRPTMSSKALETDTDRDCARHCMDESEFRCRSFYFCRQQSEPEGSNQVRAKGEGNCYLRVSHLTTIQESPMISNGPGSGQVCDFYSRSYLAEFDKFHGMALPEVTGKQQMEDKSGVEQLKGVGSEACAIECAELGGQCEAFQVCRNAAIAYEPTCTLQLNTRKHVDNETSDNKETSNEAQPVAHNWALKLFLFLIGTTSGYIVAVGLKHRDIK